MRYRIMLKSNFWDVYYDKYTKIKINSDDTLTLEKTLNIENLVTLTKSVFNKNHNHYYCETLLELFSYN